MITIIVFMNITLAFFFWGSSSSEDSGGKSAEASLLYADATYIADSSFASCESSWEKFVFEYIPEVETVIWCTSDDFSVITAPIYDCPPESNSYSSCFFFVEHQQKDYLVSWNKSLPYHWNFIYICTHLSCKIIKTTKHYTNTNKNKLQNKVFMYFVSYFLRIFL